MEQRTRSKESLAQNNFQDRTTFQSLSDEEIQDWMDIINSDWKCNFEEK